MLRKTTILALALALFSATHRSSAQTPTQIPDVGQKAPSFSLTTPEGKPLTLDQFTRKSTVVLVVLRGFPGYQCPYCVKQVHDIIENAPQFAAQKTPVLIIYPGPAADLDQHAKEALAKQNPLPANVHLLIDPDYKFTNQYGLRWDAPRETAYPSTFLIDTHDTVLFRKVSKAHGDRTTSADILAELQKTQH